MKLQKNCMTYQKKILINTSSFNINNFFFFRKKFNLKKYKIIFNKKIKTDYDLIKSFRKHQPEYIVAGLENLNEKTLSAIKYKLLAISRVGVGIDNIDLNYIKKNKIKLFVTNNKIKFSVSEHTIFFILYLIKKMKFNIKKYKKKENNIQGSLLKDKTVGIIGLGNIGKKVANDLSKLSCKILFYDPFVDFYKSYKKILTIKNLFNQCDIVTIHASYDKRHHNIIDKNVLNSAKKNQILINTSRGGFINEDHLFSHLKKNKLYSVATDVFKKEPYKGKLLKLNNLVSTNHIASNSKETRDAMEKDSIESILKYDKKK